MKATIGDLIYYNGFESEPPCFGVVSSIKNRYMAIVSWPFPDGDGDVTSEIDIKEVYTGQNQNLTVMKKRGG
jgi:hypothetical protein